MKKLLFLLSASLFVLTSCSNDDTSSVDPVTETPTPVIPTPVIPTPATPTPVIPTVDPVTNTLIKKIVFTDEDNNTDTSLITYNDKQIVNIDNSN